jgi:amino acid transporter
MQKKTVFVRDATGLVKQISAFDSFVLNNAILNVPVGMSVGTLILLGFFFPGVSLTMAFLLGFLGSIPAAILYVQMTAAMPRSGGDYIWVSRTLHPAIGFMGNWANSITMIGASTVLVAITISTFLLPSQLSVLGALTNTPSLRQLGALIATPPATLVICTTLLAVSAVNSLLGLKWVRRAWTIEFILMVIGLAAGMIVFAATPPAAFVAKFDSYSSALGTTYAGVIAAATKAGWTAQYSPVAALAALPFTLGGYGGFSYAIYLSGEMKRAPRTLLLSIMGCLLLGAVMWVGSAYLLEYSAGPDFLSALSYLSFAHPEANPLTVPGTFNMILNILSFDNPVVYWLIFIGYLVAFVMFVLGYFQIVSRIYFAWSFDRILPSFMADVGEKFHAPTKSIIVTFILAEIFAVVWIVIPFPLSMFNWGLVIPACYAIMGIAGIVFPFTSKDIYNAAPKISKLEVARVPLVTICGILTTVVMLSGLWYAYVTPSYSGPTSPAALTATTGLFISGLIVFYLVKAYRKTQGIDLGMVFKQIPPE